MNYAISVLNEDVAVIVNQRSRFVKKMFSPSNELTNGMISKEITL